MAIYLPRTHSLVLEVPKTGSKWLRAAIAKAGVPCEQIGDPQYGGHGDLATHGRDFRFIACFVRSPLTWYRSYWAYRTERRWRPHFVIDRLCASDTMSDFVRKAARLLPGHLATVYETYAGPRADPIQFVGRQERLAEDLVAALREMNETFDERSLRATAEVNATSTKAAITDDLRDLLLCSEYEVFARFGYIDDVPDPLGLRDLARRFPGDFSALRRLAIWTESIHWRFDDPKAASGEPVKPGTRYARTLTNFALYVQHVLGDIDEAESLFRRASNADPNHPRTAGSFAAFLENVRGDYSAAECLYEHALRVRPKHPNNLGNFAIFLKNVRHDYERAEDLYRQALAIDGGHAKNLGSYAHFLCSVRHDHDGAEELYQRAIEVDSRDAINLGNYALFLEQYRRDFDRAEVYFRRALNARYPQPQNLVNYALFLTHVRHDLGAAEALLRRAVANAGDPHVLVSLAQFLHQQRSQSYEAEHLCRQALELSPGYRAALSLLREVLSEQNRLDER
jgi:Tfp pilus assembly protein PilF